MGRIGKISVLTALALCFVCTTAQGQLTRRLQDAATRAVERAATQQTENRVENAVNNAIDGALDGNQQQQQGQQQQQQGQQQGQQQQQQQGNQQQQQAGAPSNAGSANTASNTVSNTSAQRFTETPDNAGKKFPFKHGSYVQVTKAMGMEVKTTVYFDNWGDWTATENKSEMRILGRTIKTDKIDIVKGNLHWDIDLVERTGTHYESIALPNEAAEPLAVALAGQIQEGMKIEELGEERYLSYICKKIRATHADMNMDVTALSFGNLPMKTEGKVMGMEVNNLIIEISESAPPASKFEVPAGIKIEKVDNK